MSFKQDVFISYAHIDNQPFTPEQKGWVTLFHGVLQTMLNQLLGKPANIWRDERLQGNDDFSAEITDKFPETATLISVLTPRYLQSSWCTKEIQTFCQIAGVTGGLFVENKVRVFKVIKTPIERAEAEKALPREVGKATGYEFFEEGQAAPELDPAFGDTYRQKFLVKTRTLAGDVAGLLVKLGAVVKPDGHSVPDKEKSCIYLAECGTSRKYDRETLQADLKSHGYLVLPEDDLPQDEEGYVSEVERLLGKCKFSVHLIGSTYGAVPDGNGQKSTVVLQNELAAKFSQKSGLSRVISLPEGTSSTSPIQQQFIDALLRDSELQFGADLVTGDLQAVTNTIHEALKKIEQPKSPQQFTPTGDQHSNKIVHVLYDEKDGKEVIPLLKFLKEKGHNTSRPIFTGENAGKVREANQALYMECDAVIIFYGRGDQTWKYYQQAELKKMRALRSGKPPLAELTYVTTPTTADKEMLISLGEEDVVDGLNGLSDQGMAQLVHALSLSEGIK